VSKVQWKATELKSLPGVTDDAAKNVAAIAAHVQLGE
jgi:hypothetical protein